MKTKSEITQRKFNKLLKWLDEDKDAAARKYYSIHRRLVQIFLARKAFPADELADRTIDRVAEKINSLVETYEGEPALYFYKTAQIIFWEYLKEPKPAPLDHRLPEKQLEENEDTRRRCLKSCLKNFSPEQRELLLEYFRYRKPKKIEHHKKISEKLGIDRNTLRTRIYRLKSTLEECLRECLGKK